MSLAHQLFDLDIQEAIPAPNIKYGAGFGDFYRSNKKGFMVGGVVVAIAAFAGWYIWRNKAVKDGENTK